MLPPEDYKGLFIDNKTGEKILQELSMLFYDRLSYMKGDPYETAFNEGQRSVIEYILRKTSQISFTDTEE